MTSATETFRAMLDERGVEYRFNEIAKVFEWHFEGTDGDGSAHATEVNGGINIIACSLTPEQAIGATLGPVTLSASQVSNAVYVHSIHADCADADWQAIADELNNVLRRGTCHNLKASWPSLFECDECGYSNDDTYCGSERHFKFCPNCGAKVVDE